MTKTKSECAKMGSAKSREVSARIRENNIRKYYQNPKRCKFCGHTILYENKRNIFCSSSCAASFNNRGVHRRGRPRKNCLYCGQPVKSLRASGFCCISHGRLYRIQNKSQDLPKLSTKSMRKYLIEIRGHRCEKCKLSEWNGEPIPLDLHHIDCNRDNQNIDNLILLCKNCHGLTESYGERK